MSICANTGSLFAPRFGLEREELLKRQNNSMAMLTLLVLLAASVYLIDVIVVPVIDQSRPAPTAVPIPTVTASPVAASRNIVVEFERLRQPQRHPYCA